MLGGRSDVGNILRTRGRRNSASCGVFISRMPQRTLGIIRKYLVCRLWGGVVVSALRGVAWRGAKVVVIILPLVPAMAPEVVLTICPWRNAFGGTRQEAVPLSWRIP